MGKPDLMNAYPGVRSKKNFYGTGLNEYAGQWDTSQIVHLLKRTLFGARIEDVNYFRTLTMSQGVDELLTEIPAPLTSPLNNYSSNGYADPTGVAAWQTWINTGIDFADAEMNQKRIDSMRCWWMGQLLNENKSIHEKITLFWHNHFASDAGVHAGDIPASLWFGQYLTLHKNALGNFKQLIKAITLDPAMLMLLNGNTNKKHRPMKTTGVNCRNYIR